VFLESSAWDLTLVFGKTDTPANTVVQNSSITIPWSQAKALLYFLQFHLIDHEMLHGRIFIPKGVIPHPFPPVVEAPTDETGKKTLEAVQEMFRQFSESNPEIL
jgi:hypothetical protein